MVQYILLILDIYLEVIRLDSLVFVDFTDIPVEVNSTLEVHENLQDAALK